MSLCLNPSCSKPDNQGNLLFCQTCGSQLLLEDCYRVMAEIGCGGFAKTYEVDDCGTAKVLRASFITSKIWGRGVAFGR